MSTDDIMRATWHALCATGYADLTMQDIADETEKSKAALHYHYDSKQELLESFLDHVTDRFFDRLRAAEREADDDPRARLSAVVDVALSSPDTDELADLQRALVELRAQAPHEPAYAERICEADTEFRAMLADILADGVDAGAFQSDIDPERTAHTIAVFFDGGQLRQVSLTEDCDTGQELLGAYLDRCVYREAT